jgi:hypothetical protein
MRVRPIFALLLLCLLSIPALAAPGGCSDPIRSLTPSDAQTGASLTITWSLGGLTPISQTLTGHDFDTPVVVAPNQLSYTYVPTKPGEKQVTLTVVTECGTFTLTRKYHVEQCNLITPFLTLDKTTSVAPGETINASIDLQPGHTARWVVTNGTPSATSGASIQIVAGASGSVGIEVFVARGNSCEVSTRASVPIVQPCSIVEPALQSSPAQPVPNNPFRVFLAAPKPGETATFTVDGASLLGTDPTSIVVIAPASGSFTINVTLTNGNCTKIFSRTYTITPCNATAVVSKVSGSCGSGIVAADFTGTAPFQGRWSDGVTFVTNDAHIERSVTRAGTYRITSFRDANCAGPATGSATVSAVPPVPQVFVDQSTEDGTYYGFDSCPNLVRTARVVSFVPAGYEVIWSIDNGTIVSGQGTTVMQFTGTNPGPTPVSAVLRNTADGCSSQAGTFPYLVTNGPPEVSISVEPATIGPGGTAIVTLTRNQYARSGSVSASLPYDNVVPIDDDGTTTHYEYRSASGPGVSTITASFANACNESAQASTTLTIDGNIQVPAKATVRLIGSSCHDNAVFAEFTGTPPFTGRWSTGETFFDYNPSAILYPTEAGTYTLTEFSDANGAGTITGSATFDYAPLPRPQITSVNPACPNSVVTATITSPIPEGATITWSSWNGTILSGQGTDTVQVQLGDTDASVIASLTTPQSCSPDGFWYISTSQSVMQPVFSLFGVYPGTSTDIYVSLDQNTESWGFENSMGDAMEIVETLGPNFYHLRYTSSHGSGDSTVRIFGTTHCGTPFESTAVMTVFPVPPSATLTSTPGATCGATVTATLNGVAPFTGRWSDTGETFTTSDTTVTHFVRTSQSIGLLLTDATGQTRDNSIFVQVTTPPPMGVGAIGHLCLGATMTVTAGPVPEGAEIIWTIEGPNARIVSGQGTTELVIEGVEPGDFNVEGRYRTPDGCESTNSGARITVLAPAANPVITLPQSSITAGSTIDLTVAFDERNYQSLNWESSMGDALFNVDQTGMTFTLRYISQNGPGTSTIRVYGVTECGEPVESTITLTITP